MYASRLGHKSMEKNSVRNSVQYGPKTRLIKGIYFFLSLQAGGILQILQSDWFREREIRNVDEKHAGSQQIGSFQATFY